MSGVAVAQMTRSRSSAAVPASASAARAAGSARSLAACVGAAIRRSRIPVRVVIHSSEVSTISSRSAFVSTLSGAYAPTPVMPTERPFPETFASALGTVRLRDRERQRAADGETACDARGRLPAPDRTSHPLELARELELVARLDDPLEADVVDAGEEGELPPVDLVGEDGDGTRLGHRLDHEDARHNGAAGKVARQVPLVGPDALTGDHTHARLEHGHLVEEQEGVAVREDLLDLPPAERQRERHPREVSSSPTRSRARARCT